jgi:hypothetical protein
MVRVKAKEDIRRQVTNRLIIKKGSLGKLVFDNDLGKDLVIVRWDGKKNLSWDMRSNLLEIISC